MAAPLALVWELIARDNASATFDRVGDSAARNAEKTASFGAGMAKLGEAVGVAAIAVGAVSLKMAADYQTNVTKLVTTAGESKDAIGMVSQGMLDMAGQVGISAETLSKGMYIVESAGFHSADGLNVLKASAEGAKQENADLSKVTDAVSTALHDYHLPASDAANITSQLITAVSHGKTNFDEFTGALHSVTPIASAAGINLADVTGVLTSMTASGMSAEQAAQNLGSTIKRFSGGGLTQPMIQELGAVGISAQDLVNNLGDGPGKTGLAATLQKVSTAILDHMGPAGTVLLNTMNQSTQAGHDAQRVFDALPPAAQKVAKAINDGTLSYKDFRKEGGGLAVEQRTQVSQWATLHDKATGFSQALKSGSADSQNYVAALAKATGGQEALSVMLQSTGENAAATNAAIKDIAGSTAQADGNIKGWDEVQGTFNQKLSEVVAGMKSWFIELGQHLLPKATEFLTWLQDSVKWMGEHKSLMEGIGKAVGVAAAALVTYAAATKTVAATKAVWTAMTSPIGLVTVAVVGLTVGIADLYKNNKGFHDWADNSLVPFFKDRLPTAIKGTKDAVAFLKDDFTQFKKDVPTMLDFTEKGFQQLSDVITGKFIPASTNQQKAVDLTKTGFSQLGSILSGSFLESAHKASQATDDLGKGVQSYSTGIDGTQVKTEGFKKGFVDTTQVVQLTKEGFGQLSHYLSGDYLRGTSDASGGTTKLADASAAAKDAADKLKETQDKLKDAQNHLNDAMQQGADKFQILNKGALDQSSANDALMKAENALTDSVHQNGTVIDGNTSAALSNRDAVKTAIQALSDKVQADYTANLSTMTLTEAQQKAKEETDQGKEALIRIAGQLGITGGAFNDLTGTIHAVPTQHDIDVTNNALASQQAIDLLSSSIHSIPAQTKIAIDIAAGQQLNKDAGFTNGPNADGNIYTAYANGGVENHVAQIAGKSGHGRLWAEDETGGESYIPLHPSKRDRSLDIWHQTGKLLGAFADGGITSGVDINVVTDLSAAMNAVKARVKAGADAAHGGVIPTGEHLALIDAALAADGIPSGQWPAWESGMNTLIGRESGWNAGAVNNTDINAQEGHPSGGLTQTIRSTFDLNRNPSLPYDMFDPVANIAASINYINSTYGGIGNVQQANANMAPMGYDSGGLLMPGYTHVYNGTGVPEVVTPPGAGQFSGKDVIVNVYSQPGQSGEQIALEVKRQLLFEMR